MKTLVLSCAILASGAAMANNVTIYQSTGKDGQLIFSDHPLHKNDRTLTLSSKRHITDATNTSENQNAILNNAAPVINQTASLTTHVAAKTEPAASPVNAKPSTATPATPATNQASQTDPALATSEPESPAALQQAIKTARLALVRAKALFQMFQQEYDKAQLDFVENPSLTTQDDVNRKTRLAVLEQEMLTAQDNVGKAQLYLKEQEAKLTLP